MGGMSEKNACPYILSAIELLLPANSEVSWVVLNSSVRVQMLSLSERTAVSIMPKASCSQHKEKGKTASVVSNA